jgi:hypothetical protein
MFPCALRRHISKAIRRSNLKIRDNHAETRHESVDNDFAVFLTVTELGGAAQPPSFPRSSLLTHFMIQSQDGGLLPETKSPANTTPGASIAKKGSLTACSGD